MSTIFDNIRKDSLECNIKHHEAMANKWDNTRNAGNLAAKEKAMAEKFKAELQAELIAEALRRK